MTIPEIKGYSPAPWSVTTGEHTETTDMYDEGETWFNVNNEDGVIADFLHGRCLDTNEESAAANAQLCALAPTLYERVRELERENERLSREVLTAAAVGSLVDNQADKMSTEIERLKGLIEDNMYHIWKGDDMVINESFTEFIERFKNVHNL